MPSEADSRTALRGVLAQLERRFRQPRVVLELPLGPLMLGGGGLQLGHAAAQPVDLGSRATLRVRSVVHGPDYRSGRTAGVKGSFGGSPGSRRDSAMLERVLAWIAWEHLALAGLAWALLTAGSLAVVLRIVLALPHDYFEVDASPRTAWTAASCRAQRRRDPAHRRRHRAVLPRGSRPGRAHRAGRHVPGRFSTAAAAGARAGAPAWRVASAQPPALPLRSPATTTAATVGSAQRPKVAVANACTSASVSSRVPACARSVAARLGPAASEPGMPAGISGLRARDRARWAYRTFR